jgi:hypothetical protein
MSAHFAASADLTATTNLLNPVSCTRSIWVKFDAALTGNDFIFVSTNTGFTSEVGMQWILSPAHLYAISNGTGGTQFGSDPTATHWVNYMQTSGAAGASSVNSYFQDNSGGGFTTIATTGVNFTNVEDFVLGSNADACTAAYYMEWSVVLGSTDRNTQFLSATPVVQLGSLRRYLAMTNAASVGTDTSGNSFNMTGSGTITDGASLPTFPVPGGGGGLSGGLSGNLTGRLSIARDMREARKWVRRREQWNSLRRAA